MDAAPSEDAATQSVFLMDLDNETISLALDSLAAHDQARAAATCKLFALLVHEKQKDETFLVSAVTNSVEETRDVLAPKLTAPPTSGVIFSNEIGAARRTAIKALVRSLPPHSRIIGAEVNTLVGMHDGELAIEDHSGFALSLGAFPEAQTGSFFAKPANPGEALQSAALREQLTAQGCLEPGWKVIVLIVAGRVAGFEAALREVQAANPEAAIIGGVATGSWLLHAHAHKVEYVRSGVVGLMYKGNVPLKALVCKHTARPKLMEAKRQFEEEGKELLGGLMFTCTARDESQDAKDFASAFPRCPIVGMPSGGEIGPSASRGRRGGNNGSGATQVGHVEMQGFTSVYGLFAVPIKERPPVDVNYEDVAAAWKEGREKPAAMELAAAAATAAEVAASEGPDDAEDDDEEEEEEDDEDEYDEEEEDYDEDDEDFDQDEFDDDAEDFFGGDGEEEEEDEDDEDKEAPMAVS